jgi:hypothetical protein
MEVVGVLQFIFLNGKGEEGGIESSQYRLRGSSSLSFLIARVKKVTLKALNINQGLCDFSTTYQKS